MTVSDSPSVADATRRTVMERGSIPVVVVGAGQAGLAAAHALQRASIDCVVLDSEERLGDAWRRRWDSLRLFTPAAYDGLPGLPFPAAATYFPTKDEMADYLESYARHFDLPVRLGTTVKRVVRERDSFRVETDRGEAWQGRAVVIATGGHQAPWVPPIAAQLSPGIVQLHSAEYRNPSQFAPGAVLVVGAGNSGAEIAIEAARGGHQTWLAGRSTGRIPPPVYAFNGRIMMFLARRVLTRQTPIGRRMADQVLSRGGPLIRLAPSEVTDAGASRTGRVVGVEDGCPVVESRGRLDASTVVWATGFRPDLGWIEPRVTTQDGRADQALGVARAVPDVYFVGQPFQTGFTSAFVDGVGRDAERVVRVIQRRLA